MKFENSLQETRYNKYWNAVVVACDKKILGQFKYNPSFSSTTSVLVDIANYTQHIINLVNNLVRQSTDYTDTRYVASYINATKEQAKQDLNHYKTLMTHSQSGRYKESMFNVDVYIDAITALPCVGVEHESDHQSLLV